MFSVFKKFFGKRATDVIEAPGSTRPAAAGGAPSSNGQRSTHPEPASRPPVTTTGNVPAALSIPLKSIIARLPADLMQRVRQADVGETEISIPMQRILSQIALGTVKINFGELRQAAPSGTFSVDSDRDRVTAEVPLQEILTRLNPSMLPRRPAQKHVTVPADIAGPFGGKSQITFTTAPLKTGAPAQPAPAAANGTVEAPASVVEAPAPVPFTPTAPVAAPAAGQAAPPQLSPVAPIKPVQPLPQQQKPVAVPSQPAPMPARPAQPFQPSIAVAQGSTPPVRPAVAAAPAAMSARPPAPVAPSAPPVMPNRPMTPAAFQQTAATPAKAPVALQNHLPGEQKKTDGDSGFFKRTAGPQTGTQAPVPPQHLFRPSPAAPAPAPRPAVQPAASAPVPASAPNQSATATAPVPAPAPTKRMQSPYVNSPAGGPEPELIKFIPPAARFTPAPAPAPETPAAPQRPAPPPMPMPISPPAQTFSPVAPVTPPPAPPEIEVVPAPVAVTPLSPAPLPVPVEAERVVEPQIETPVEAAFVAAPASEPAPVEAPAPVPMPAPTPAQELEPAPVPFRQTAPVASESSVISPIAPVPEPEPQPIPFNLPAPEPAAPPVPNIAGETRFLTISISDIASGWPEAVKSEIVANQLTTTSVALPFGFIEQAIRQGKVALSWKVLRSWTKPPAFIPNSPNDSMVLELPLKVLTPIFLAELKAAKPQKRVSLDENIPDLFSGRKSDVTGPAIPANVPVAAVSRSSTPNLAPVRGLTPKPADTNYFAKMNGDAVAVPPEEPAPQVKPGPSPGTAFLNRYATPNEIVSKAAAMDGVDGALIALPDGLLVASKLPTSMNADTVAGFLPQIFGRVSQCTKELRLGDLNNLNFTVGNVPWKIFKVGAIFFAAFGRPGEALPTAQLAGIAAELDRKAK